MSNVLFSGPDIPTDTEENNALLAMPTREKRIQFDEITPYKSVRAFMKQMYLFESLLDEMEQGALDGDTKLTLEQVIDQIDGHLVPLTYAYSTISLLTTAQTDVHRYKIMEDVTKIFDRVRTRRFRLIELYTFLEKELADPHRTRNRFRRRAAEKYLLEGKLNGLGLGIEGMDEIDKLQQMLADHTKKFCDNVDTSNKLIQEFIISPSTLNTLPLNFLRKDERTWSPFDNSIYTRFMQNCDSSAFRRNFFDNYNQRAFKKEFRDSNSVPIEEIRDVRKKFANYLGYENYVCLSMETKMAGFVTNVRTMLNTMHQRCQTALVRDLKELTEFANKASGGKVEELELWDLEHYRYKYMQTTRDAASQAMQAIYPFESVLSSLINLCSRLFQIEIVEVEAGHAGREKQFSRWHPSVRLFDVFSPNGFYGSFYLDPFARHGKDLKAFAQTHFLVSRSDIIPVRPVSAVVLSLPQPLIPDQPAHISFNDTVRLFNCFGSVLQHTLTEVPFSDVNGLSNLEWDAVSTIPEFMSLWPLYDHKTLTDCAAGTQTTISLDLQKSIAERHFKFHTIGLINELYKSALDLALNSNPEFFQDLVDELWATYMKPYPLTKTDFHICSATDIIVQKPAAYYCALWSKMLAADLFENMHEYGRDEKSVSEQGVRLRETFLSESGAHPSSEMFKSLTQRNPSVDPFLGLSKSCIVFESTN